MPVLSPISFNQSGGVLPFPGPPEPSALPQAPARAPDPTAGGFAQGLANLLANHPLTLVALGGGIAQGGIGKGLTTALGAAQAEQQQHRQEQVQRTTYQALRGSGIPEGLAQAAALNPEVLKAVARSLVGAGLKPAPTEEVIGRDEQGRPTYGFVDAGSKSVTPYRPPNLSPLENAVGELGKLTTEDGGHRTDSGNPSSKLAPAQAGVRPPSTWVEETGRLLRAAGVGDAEVRAWQDKLAASNSPAELKAAVAHGVDLIDARLGALSRQYESAVRRKPPTFLSPNAMAALERMRAWAGRSSD